MECARKILTRDELVQWRQEFKAAGKKLVVTNGCFDLLHAGHVLYLESARNLGDGLLVGVNSDAAVRALKGPERPLNSQADRTLVVAGLESVTAVLVFEEVRATEFLRLAQPDIYVKGGDYTLETLDQDERRAVEQGGGRIHLIPFVPGKSTSGIIARMKNESARG